MMAVGAWIILVQAFAKSQKDESPELCFTINPRQFLKPQQLLMGLIAVCITVLGLSLLMRDRLCSFSVISGNTAVQATLSCTE
ncbi:Hok/Gef family protein [Providencia sp. PROV210]|uniref:Hok/Gef family protein n=1 Tax=Providencia sp. PROV210 TaxID=2949907 RepID=UPI00234AE008|nr:Hok/Gef family protein [Providencia sp. PROV210]